MIVRSHAGASASSSPLEDHEFVRHRVDYWATADADDIETTLSALSTARAATDRLGPEDPAEWGPGVDANATDK